MSQNVVLANEAAKRMLNSFVDLDRWPRPRNILQMIFAARRGNRDVAPFASD
jgi:hypothetical protein